MSCFQLILGTQLFSRNHGLRYVRRLSSYCRISAGVLGQCNAKSVANISPPSRCYTQSSVAKNTASKEPSALDFENTNVGHARFLAEASPGKEWKHDAAASLNGGKDWQTYDEFEGLAEGKGKLSPTSSHLFKLILPLGSLSHPSNTCTEPPARKPPSPASSANPPVPPPTVLLLHPSQPLSHVSRLILASLSPATPAISFRSTSSGGQAYQWSDSTDLGDFIRDAAHAAKFSICLTYGHPPSEHPALYQEESRFVVTDGREEGQKSSNAIKETIIDVEVPTFADRTRFLRRRLAGVERKLHAMEGLKKECEQEAHRGAKRMALGGFGMLVVYWGAVARLTFWDFGWDVMEPITYLSGLSTVVLGYLWFLYRGREVSYSSVLHSSISARREALYKARGLDIELWMDLVSERRHLRKEIRRIAEDYDPDSNRGARDYDDNWRKADEAEKAKDEKKLEEREEIEMKADKNVVGDGAEDAEEARGEREKSMADRERVKGSAAAG
ncbi:hypothetical protein BDQ17DRAFT_1272035 [Cyathus striatus]|nr:hypothetical protein BDQ17DRAFT_1272035 [Cyathus striatus]